MQPKPKILIVDDEAGPRESLKIILKPEFEVVTVSRGSDALEMLRDGSFEVVLLDLTMPEDLSGTETLQSIRDANIDVEAIVISGQGAADPIMACVNLGAFRYIKKPYRADEVVGAVRDALHSRETRRRQQAMRERFLGSLSHELRTPLNAIVGYSEILHDEIRDLLAEEHRHALARIQHSSERLLAYWEGLFFLGELDSGSLLVQPRELEVQPWLQRLVQRIDRSSEGGPSLHLDCPQGLWALTHPETLARLLAVLIYEATEDQSGPIVVSAWDPGDAVCFAVEHDLLPFETPPAEGSSDQDATATELAREVVARASDLLGATVERTSAGPGRIRILITVPPMRDPTRRSSLRRTHFPSGVMAAATR